MLDHALGRFVLTAIAGYLGGAAGTLAYFAILFVTFNPPESGDIHVGILPLALLGLAVAVWLMCRWIKRARAAVRPTA